MLEPTLRALKFLAARYDDDSVDRLHYFLTSNMLIALSILISYKQFGGKPIECMTPKMFPHSWDDYTENYCWAQDTYKVSFDENMPDPNLRYTNQRRISYYQWVPFFLLIEAVCFRLPSLIWKYLASHSGIKIHDIVKLAVDEKNVEPNVKQANLKSLTVHLQNALKFHRRLYRRQITPHKLLRCLNLPYSAIYVTSIYLLTKLLYLINVVCQLIMMNRFLETDRYSLYGFGAFFDLLNGTTWEQSLIFPRVTLCDFKVRGMGNIQPYSVQCVLTINIFNEKIFVFLWFWYLILFVMTLVSFLYWFIVSVFPWPSRWFITQHLELSEMAFDPKNSAKDVERFVAGYLKTDGVFVLRMITTHSGIIFGTDLILSLYRSFYGIEETIQRQITGNTPQVLSITMNDDDKTKKINFARARLNAKKKKAAALAASNNSGNTSDNDMKQALLKPSDQKSPKKPPVPPKPSAPAPQTNDPFGTTTSSRLKRQASDLDSYISQHSV